MIMMMMIRNYIKMNKKDYIYVKKIDSKLFNFFGFSLNLFTVNTTRSVNNERVRGLSPLWVSCQ